MPRFVLCVNRSELNGIGFYPKIGDRAYLTAVVANPYAGGTFAPEGVDRTGFDRAMVGYLALASTAAKDDRGACYQYADGSDYTCPAGVVLEAPPPPTAEELEAAGGSALAGGAKAKAAGNAAVAVAPSTLASALVAIVVGIAAVAYLGVF